MLPTLTETDYRPISRSVSDYGYMIYLSTEDSDDFFTNIVYLE